jgi:UDP-perosamine 4-acetyltransferase
MRMLVGRVTALANFRLRHAETSIFGILILGGGSHAKVLIDALCSRRDEFRGAIVDPNPELKDQSVYGLPVIGGDEVLMEATAQNYTHFIVGVGGISLVRQELFLKAKNSGLSPITVVHENTNIAPDVEIGGGSMVFAGGLINAAAVLGENVIVNTGAIIEHDCQVGAHAHIGPRSCLLGSAEVGEGAWVGAGSIVLEGRKIGKGAMVGAGAIVTKDVADGTKVVGNPARQIPF